MEALLVKIGQLAIFLICAQTLMHFRPKGSYEKYIKLLVSIMLLILLVEPIMDLLGKDDQGDFLERIQVYEEELQGILASPDLESEEIETILKNMTSQSVTEGEVYVQQEDTEKGANEEPVPVSGKAVEGENKEETSGNISIQVEVEKIEEIEIGADYGKSAENP